MQNLRSTICEANPPTSQKMQTTVRYQFFPPTSESYWIVATATAERKKLDTLPAIAVVVRLSEKCS